MKHKIIFILVLLLNISFIAKAQIIEDALRFVSPNAFSSVRAAALGGAYFGFSDDGTAILTNPAGLTLIPVAEFGIGMNLTSHKTTTNFLGNNKNDFNNEFFFTNANFIFPSLGNYNYNTNEYEPTENKSNFKFGFDYHISNDFDISTTYSAFNPYNTFIAQQAYTREKEWVREMKLADSNYYTYIQNNLQQDGIVTESGGLHNLSFGFGVDINSIFSLGATFIMKFGTYEYTRRYFELDKNNLHNEYLIDDIDQLIVREKITQDLFGITGILGIQARLSRYCRLGVSIKFPTWMSDSNYFATNYDVVFDPVDGIVDRFNYKTGTLYNTFDVITPFEFTLGLSGNTMGLSYSISGSLLNASSTYFSVSKDNMDMEYFDLIYFDELNELIEDVLTMQYMFSAGLEYKIPMFPLYLRGSYTLKTSPYKNKDICSDNSIIGAGVGFVLTNNLIIDAAFVYSMQDYRRANYGNESVPHLYSFYDVQYSPKSFMLGFRYRFN